MRILQINSARVLGGGERHLSDLTRGLVARGHEVHAALRPSSPLREEFDGLGRVKVVTLPLRNSLDLQSALGLARYVREQRIQIVHAHVARDYTLAALAARAAPHARLVITRHLLYPLNRLHALTLPKETRAIAVSGGVARVLRAQRLFAPDNIHLIPNGIDVSRFERAAGDAARLDEFRRRLPSRAPRLVGVAGELREHKGQEEFVRAAAALAPQFPEADFLIAGEDASHDKAYRGRLERLVNELGLEGRVHLLGWLEDVAPFMRSLEVFVSSSRVEPFGLVMAEAMASGAAVVATDTDGAREIIEDGVTGRLVPVGDASALASAVADLLSDGTQRRALAERARAAVRERFGLARMVEETERVYEEALGLRNTGQYHPR